MYVDGYFLLVIYLIAVLAAAISVYALWSLEEIRRHYERRYNRKTNTYAAPKVTTPTKKHSQAAGYYDKFIGK
jgi:hypothetical protein